MIKTTPKFAMEQFNIILFIISVGSNQVLCHDLEATTAEDNIELESLSGCAVSAAERKYSFFALCMSNERGCNRAGCMLLHEMKEPNEQMVYYEIQEVNTPSIGIELTLFIKTDTKDKVRPECIFPSGKPVVRDSVFYVPKKNIQILAYDIMKKSVYETGLLKPKKGVGMGFAVQECIVFNIQFRKKLTRKYFNDSEELKIFEGFVRTYSYDTTTKRLVTLWYHDGNSLLKLSSLHGTEIRVIYESPYHLIGGAINARNSRVSWTEKSDRPSGEYDLFYSMYDVNNGKVKPTPIPLKERLKKEHTCMTTGAQLVRRGSKAASMIDLVTKRKQEFPCPEEGIYVADCIFIGRNIGVGCVMRKNWVMKLRAYSPNGTLLTSSDMNGVWYTFSVF